MDWNAEVVDQLETHWHRQSRPRLDGLTDEEYFWQPAPDCWTVRSRDGRFTLDLGESSDGPDPVTTIAWRLAHLVVGFAETNGTHFGGAPATVSTYDYAGTAEEALSPARPRTRPVGRGRTQPG